jgi:isoquinoline 1-oxidoreductase beta subunit
MSSPFFASRGRPHSGHSRRRGKAPDCPPGIPTAFWRGVGPTHNVFVVESFIDELAAAAKQDPLAYRKTLLSQNPRALAVLTLAAEKAGWGRPVPSRRGRVGSH